MHEQTEKVPTGPGRNEQIESTITPLLNHLEQVLGPSRDKDLSEERLEQVCDGFRTLHARLRLHHASSYLDAADGPPLAIRPELVRDWERIKTEYGTILGNIDRVLRSAPHMLTQGAVETDLLYLRMVELVATVRRHRAEEARLLYDAAWVDVGGES